MASTGQLAPPSVLVAGGTGFVGLSVCREAVSRGLGVVSVSRSGLAPERRTEEWMHKVTWVASDALQPEQYRAHLKGCTAVVHSVGLLVESDFLYQRVFPKAAQSQRPPGTYESTSYESAVVLLREAQAAGVGAYVYVSAVDPPPFVLGRYIAAKRRAEQEILNNEGGVRPVIFRPGIIYGPQRWYSLPLMAAFSFLQAVGLQPPQEAPMAVADVAKAAVNACLDANARGVYDVPGMAHLAEGR